LKIGKLADCTLCYVRIQKNLKEKHFAVATVTGCGDAEKFKKTLKKENKSKCPVGRSFVRKKGEDIMGKKGKEISLKHKSAKPSEEVMAFWEVI